MNEGDVTSPRWAGGANNTPASHGGDYEALAPVNIPDEVDRRFGKPEDCNEIEIAMRLGFKAGAEWARREARKEALREAADAIEKLDGHFNWDEIHRVAPWLRSLAEGISNDAW